MRSHRFPRFARYTFSSNSLRIPLFQVLCTRDSQIRVFQVHPPGLPCLLYRRCDRIVSPDLSSFLLLYPHNLLVVAYAQQTHRTFYQLSCILLQFAEGWHAFAGEREKEPHHPSRRKF